MRLVLIVEAQADADMASVLADRVFIEGEADWIDAGTLPNLRHFTGIEPRGPFTRWAGLNRLAAQHGIPAHGRGLGPDALAARKALLLIVQVHRDDDLIEAVVLVRDMDNQPERRASMDAVRVELAGRLPFQVVIAAPDPKREAWILHGFEPLDQKEAGLLADERKRLGFDPIIDPQRLRGDRRRGPAQEDRDMKRVIEHLTAGDQARERLCLETTPLSVLRARGHATGLADYLAEVETRVLPLLDPGANA